MRFNQTLVGFNQEKFLVILSLTKLLSVIILHYKNKLDIGVVARPFATLYISSASCWIFLSWVENDISFFNRVKRRSTVFINHSQCSLMQTVNFIINLCSMKDPHKWRILQWKHNKLWNWWWQDSKRIMEDGIHPSTTVAGVHLNQLWHKQSGYWRFWKDRWWYFLYRTCPQEKNKPSQDCDKWNSTSWWTKYGKKTEIIYSKRTAGKQVY